MPHEPGTVMLVGAGPGPADLLTLRAIRAIEGAEALLYDALVSPEVLALAPKACVKIQTGKRAGRASMAQEAIIRLRQRLARRGLKVVRLKGGDPSIFGRSGEETEFLAAHGVETTVIPGITAASAAAAQFRFPLTHRGEARRVTFATARIETGGMTRDGWAAVSDPASTLALYMGREAFPEAARRLIAEGRPASTPALAVENAGAPNARLFGGDLETLPAMLAAAECDGPVVILVGEVAARAKAATAAEGLRRAAG